MIDLLLIARLLLALVFSVAGITKLLDVRGSRLAVAGFGIPERLAPVASVGLPVAELAIAVALIAMRTAWFAALAAAALLALFVAGIAANLLRGRRPSCHCFGQLHSEPIGPWTIARNTALFAIAAYIAVAGRTSRGGSATDWFMRLSGAERIGLVVATLGLAMIVALWWVVLALLRQNGRLLTRVEHLEAVAAQPAPEPPAVNEPEFGLPVSGSAPGFVLPGLFGETMTLNALRAQGSPILLVFSRPNCGPCSALMPDVARWQRDHRGQLTTAVIASGGADENLAKSLEHGLSTVLLQDNDDVASSYKSPGTPSAVIVLPDGTIGSPMAVGPDSVRQLVADWTGQPHVQPQSELSAVVPAEPRHPTLGMPAPHFDLPDINGRQVKLTDLAGSKTLLLFWNTGCGFCQQMLEDLRSWEQQRPHVAPKLVVFSSGPIDAVRAMGLQSPVIPDPSFTLGPRFGANGTPMAVLLDERGHIASEVAAGAPAVLELASGSAAPQGGLVPLQPDLPRPSHENRAGGVTRGQPAPTIRLPDISDRIVNLSDFKGHDTIVLFWNTGCGFCQQMLPALREWETRRPKGAPKLLVVSSGSKDEMRAMGLRSTVVVDAQFTVAPAYGTGGTPTAILVDSTGRIASDMAIGADAIMALANSKNPNLVAV